MIELFVSDDLALQEVIRTIAAALRPRHVVLCHATVSPLATRHAAGIVESQGARYLDAPFTGSKAAAQNRQLVYYIGGAKPALEEVRPVLEATSKAILHVGGIGDAAVLKIATNMMTATIVQTLAEALALVRAAGIDASKLVEALENNSSRSGTSDLKLPAMIAGNSEPNFSLKHMLKDVRFAQELADKYQLSLPVTDTAAEVLAIGMQNDWGDKDFSVVSQLYPAPEAATSPPASAPVETPAVQIAPPDPPAAVLAEPVAEPVKSPVPIPEERVAALTLPPRPNASAKPLPPEVLASEAKPPTEKPADLPDPKPAPTDQTATADKKDTPTNIERREEPASASKKDEAATPDAPKRPEMPPADVPSPNAGKTAAHEKKTTFQFVRDLFRSVPTEPR